MSFALVNPALNGALPCGAANGYAVLPTHGFLSKLSAGLPITQKPEFGRLVNFSDCAVMPNQRWFRYREGYSPTLAERFIAENHTGGIVADPFCGSGTTLLAAQRQNSASLGVEVNPVFAMLSEVKCRRYEKSALEEMRQMALKVRHSTPDGNIRKTAFPLAEKVFNSEILQALLQFRDDIDKADNPHTHDALLIAWLSILEPASNVRKEGNGIKYRFVKRTPAGYQRTPQAAWENAAFPPDRFAFVKGLLCEKIAVMIEDIKSQEGDVPPTRVVYGDCLREMEQWNDRIGTAVFSPPYCNCFDYFEIHKMEIWLGGFVKSQADMRRLRRQGFRSNTNAELIRPQSALFDEVEHITAELEKRTLWSNRIPNMVRGYFSDTARLFAAMAERMDGGARAAIVVGNSAYSGVIVPTDMLVARIAERSGFSVDNVFVCRHLTTSAQQQIALRSFREYLRESIIIIRRNG